MCGDPLQGFGHQLLESLLRCPSAAEPVVVWITWLPSSRYSARREIGLSGARCHSPLYQGIGF